MGAGNVKLVYGLWGHLNDRPFRVLGYMALTALDRDDPPRYFGGWEAIAHGGLGIDLTDLDDKALEAARKAVQRAVGECRRVGAIELLNDPRIGERSDYALRLGDAQRTPRGGHSMTPTSGQEGDTHRTPEGDTHRTPRGGQLPLQEGDAHRTPKEEPSGVEQDLRDEKRSPKVTPLSSARARADARAAAAASRRL